MFISRFRAEISQFLRKTNDNSKKFIFYSTKLLTFFEVFCIIGVSKSDERKKSLSVSAQRELSVGARQGRGQGKYIPRAVRESATGATVISQTAKGYKGGAGDRVAKQGGTAKFRPCSICCTGFFVFPPEKEILYLRRYTQ